MKYLMYVPALFLAALYGAFGFSLLWSWFVSGTFGIKEISMAEAYGVMLLVTYSTYQRIPTSGDQSNAFVEEIIFQVLKVTMSILVGGLIYALFLK